jgi:hypothetical protein
MSLTESWPPLGILMLLSTMVAWVRHTLALISKLILIDH